MTAGHFSRPGAVDLSALSGTPGPTQRPASTGESGAAGSYVLDVTEESFQADVIETSMTVPVVMDFWADWCGPCKQLSPILERLAGDYAGRFVLAKIDVDANQQLAAAVGAQSIPLVIAVVRGLPVPLFQGALPEAEVRRFLDELLKVAAANGVTGRVEPSPAAGTPVDEPAQRPGDAPLREAEAAIERGDLDAAIAAYEKVLAQSPSDREAASGLARARLLARSRNLDPVAIRADAADRRDDVSAQTAAADLDVLGGHVDDAFQRLIELVARSGGEARDQARRHLLDLFMAVGEDDPRVRSARQRLAAALF